MMDPKKMESIEHIRLWATSFSDENEKRWHEQMQCNAMIDRRTRTLEAKMVFASFIGATLAVIITQFLINLITK